MNTLEGLDGQQIKMLQLQLLREKSQVSDRTPLPSHRLSV